MATPEDGRGRGARLAPLEPDLFLAWVYNRGPQEQGTGPLTVDDIWFELVRDWPDLTLAEVRRMYVRLSALVRRNQRLGLEPLAGIY